MRLSIAEIIKKVQAAKTNALKVETLRQYNNVMALKLVLRMIYDDTVEVLLPDSEPPYKPNTFPDAHGILQNGARKLSIFVKGGGYDHLKQSKREEIFIEFLESVDKDDAILLVEMLKQRPLKNVPLKVVVEAFPGMILSAEAKKEG
tara:strand:- start:61 stop:501 length:441 start_codon:yes stop_codon:yes gene_type:complete